MPPLVGDSQRFFLRSEVMAARHSAFVTRVMSSLKAHDVAAAELDPHDALSVIREAMYRETAGSDWRAILPGDRVRVELSPYDLDRGRITYRYK